MENPKTQKPIDIDNKYDVVIKKAKERASENLTGIITSQTSKGNKSYVTRRLEEIKIQKNDQQLQELINKTLDINAPIQNARQVCTDIDALEVHIHTLLQNEAIGKSMEVMDEYVTNGDPQAYDITKRFQLAAKAYQNDMNTAQKLKNDLLSSSDELQFLIEQKGIDNNPGEVLKKAAELDALASSSNWALATQFGQVATKLILDIQEVQTYVESKQSVTDVNVVTDVEVKPTISETDTEDNKE